LNGAPAVLMGGVTWDVIDPSVSYDVTELTGIAAEVVYT